jgi:hypothetical protein
VEATWKHARAADVIIIPADIQNRLGTERPDKTKEL